MDTIRILSTNYSGQSANITFSPATGGTEVISGITIPYDFTDDFVYGDYSVFFTAYGNSCPLNVPVPSPTLSQTGATQYENVVLSASSILDGGTYIWTLTDFYSTGDTQVSSYTGQTLIEGYFTSTGNTNVRLDVVLGSATATTTDFSVVEFLPSTISDMIAWYDASDSSTITLRTGTDYIEQLNDKSGNNYDLLQPSATNQPLYSASSVNGSYSAATFDGIDNYLIVTGLTNSTLTGFTALSVGTMLDKTLIGASTNPEKNSVILTYYDSLDDWDKTFGTGFGQLYYWYNDRFSTTRNAQAPWPSSDYPDAYFVGREDTTNLAASGLSINGVAMTNYPYSETPKNIEIDTIALGNITNTLLNTPLSFKLYGEIGETMAFSRYITDEEKTKLDRYLQYKWYGNIKYITT